MNKIRFARVSSLLTEYYKSLYKRDPNLADASYDKQYRIIMDDRFGFSDYWKTNLEKTGKYNVIEILMNVEPLQKKWAKENNVSFSEDNWLDDILSEQMKRFKPEIIFVQHNMKIPLRKRLKKENPSIRLMMSWDGTFINDPKRFEECGLILSDDPINASFYSQYGFGTYHFSFGFDNKVLDKIIPRKKKHDVSFIGSLQMQNDFHAQRLKFLSAISKKVKLKTWIPYFPALFGPIDKSWTVQIKKMSPKYYLDALRIMTINRGGIYGINMFQTLADSKITLNMHSDEYIRAGNMRLWEATGVGTCLVTDYKDNITDYFKPDKEIITYKSIPEAIEKISYLLNNEKARQEIASAGQKRTLEEYSYEKRILTFSNFLENFIK